MLTETEPCVFGLCKGKESVENKTEICILNNQCDLSIIHSVANKLKYDTDLSEKKSSYLISLIYIPAFLKKRFQSRNISFFYIGQQTLTHQTCHLCTVFKMLL